MSRAARLYIAGVLGLGLVLLALGEWLGAEPALDDAALEEAYAPAAGPAETPPRRSLLEALREAAR